MLGGIDPLAGVVAALFFDDFDPVGFDVGPFAVNVMASFVFHSGKAVCFHVAGKEVFSVLGRAGLKDEDAGGDADAEE